MKSLFNRILPKRGEYTVTPKEPKKDTGLRIKNISISDNYVAKDGTTLKNTKKKLHERISSNIKQKLGISEKDNPRKKQANRVKNREKNIESIAKKTANAIGQKTSFIKDSINYRALIQIGERLSNLKSDKHEARIWKGVKQFNFVQHRGKSENDVATQILKAVTMKNLVNVLIDIDMLALESGKKQEQVKELLDNSLKEVRILSKKTSLLFFKELFNEVTELGLYNSDALKIFLSSLSEQEVRDILKSNPSLSSVNIKLLTKGRPGMTNYNS